MAFEFVISIESSIDCQSFVEFRDDMDGNTVRKWWCRDDEEVIGLKEMGIGSKLVRRRVHRIKRFQIP